MGPFAVDEGLLQAADPNGEALVRIHNTNTQKIIHARFPLVNGCAAVEGELEISGIAGTGAPVRLDFIAPGGAATGKPLPTGTVVHEVTRATDQPDSALRIGMPAGVTTAAALVRCQDGVWVAERGAFLRTQRRLFEGSVLVRAAQAAPVARLV